MTKTEKESTLDDTENEVATEEELDNYDDISTLTKAAQASVARSTRAAVAASAALGRSPTRPTRGRRQLYTNVVNRDENDATAAAAALEKLTGKPGKKRDAISSADDMDVSVGASRKQRPVQPKMTMAEMKRRVNALLAYIGRAQLTMAEKKAIAGVEKVALSQDIERALNDGINLHSLMDEITRDCIRWQEKFC